MFDPRLTEEQQAMRQLAKDFADREIKPVAIERDRLEDPEARVSFDVLRKASELGLRLLQLSPAKGGGGADALTCCIVTEELAVGDVGIASTLDQTSTWSHVWFDRAFNPEQVERFLPMVVNDHNCHLGFGGHEPDTDLGWSYYNELAPNTGYKTTAVRDGDEWVVNGVKNYITNGSIAKLLCVQVRTDQTKLGAAGVSTLILPGNSSGFTRKEHDKVGRRLGANGQLFFDNVRVPASNLVGSVGRSPLGAGDGTAFGRGAPRFQAMNLGIGRAAYEAALDYVRQRVQGGRPVIEHQAVGLVLADLAINLEVARSMIWKAAWASDHPEAYESGDLPQLPLQTIAKVFTSETVHRVTVKAMELFGGAGIMREMPGQKYVRDALIFLHSEYTADVARLRIAEQVTGYKRGAIKETGSVE
ncbi:MAG: acyl-CoA dehydrogenase family protein [Chloroflexi bacterium]|nr:acyl-CoA dehydrogenase family protein [Chloroflexota bacterium]